MRMLNVPWLVGSERRERYETRADSAEGATGSESSAITHIVRLGRFLRDRLMRTYSHPGICTGCRGCRTRVEKPNHILLDILCHEVTYAYISLLGVGPWKDKRTRFPFSYDHSAACQYLLQLLELEVSVGLVVCRAGGYQRLFYRELDDQCLTYTVSVGMINTQTTDGTDLDITKEVVIHEVRDANFARARVDICNLHGLHRAWWGST